MRRVHAWKQTGSVSRWRYTESERNYLGGISPPMRPVANRSLSCSTPSPRMASRHSLDRYRAAHEKTTTRSEQQVRIGRLPSVR
jgi:hypothetical protein